MTGIPTVSDYIDKGEHSIVISNVDLWNLYPDTSPRFIRRYEYDIFIQASIKDYQKREYRIPFEIVSTLEGGVVEMGVPILPLILGILGLIALYLLVSEIRKTSEAVIEPIATATATYFPFVLIILAIVFLPKLFRELKT